MCHGSWRIERERFSNYVQYAVVVQCPAKRDGRMRAHGRDEGIMMRSWTPGDDGTHDKRLQMRER